MKKIHTYISITSVALLSSCSNMNNPKGEHPIVLGDSATIVTEQDSQYLQDFVLDISERTMRVDTVALTSPTKEEIPVSTPAAPISKDGFEIDFGSFKALLTGIETREFRNQNPQKDPDVSYKVMKGDLLKSSLIISGLKNPQIQERYQSHLTLQNAGEILSLDKLGNYTSDWTTVTMKNGSSQSEYDLKGLGSLKFKQVSNVNLKNAVQNELRSKRANQKTIQEWNLQVAKVRSVPNPPSVVVLDNVQWRITGKDSKGNTVSKLIRIDN